MSNHARARRAMIRPDRPGMAVTAVALATVVAAAAFFISFEALTQIGRTLELPLPWLVPIALDGAILAATALLLVEASRGHRGALPWAIVYGSTLASSAANGWSHWERGQGLAPSATAALAPWLLLVLTHAIAHILVDGEPATDDAAETSSAREQAEAEHVAEAAPAVAEQVVAAVPEVVEQKLPEAVEQPARPVVSTAIEQVPATGEQGGQVEAEQVPGRVEQVARPSAAKPSSTPARKPAGTGPAAGAGMVPWTGLNADGQAARQAEAVAAVRAGGSVAGTAKQVGVPRSSLQRWVASQPEGAAAA